MKQKENIDAGLKKVGALVVMRSNCNRRHRELANMMVGIKSELAPCHVKSVRLRTRFQLLVEFTFG